MKGLAASKQLLQRLRVFHHSCLRAMCRVTRKHTIEHHISSESLMRLLELFLVCRLPTYLPPAHDC